MKKIVILFLIFVISANLFACTNKTNSEAKEKVLSKEEMLAQALEIDIGNICSASGANLASAKNEYCEKIIKLTGIVERINEDHVVLKRAGESSYCVDVYLPSEELVSIKRNYQITVVGKTSVDIIEIPNVDDTTKIEFHYQMPTAFFVTNRYETEGKLITWTDSFGNVRHKFIHDNSADYSIRCVEGEIDFSALPTDYCGTITIESEIKYDNDVRGYNEFNVYDCGYEFRNGKLVSWG